MKDTNRREKLAALAAILLLVVAACWLAETDTYQSLIAALSGL